MSSMRIKALAAFYKYYCALPLVVSALCCYLYWMDGSAFQVLAVKVVTGIGLRYFIGIFQADRLFYYYNLHISKWMLWGSYFSIDISLLILALCTINLIR